MCTQIFLVEMANSRLTVDHLTWIILLRLEEALQSIPAFRNYNVCSLLYNIDYIFEWEIVPNAYNVQLN